MDNQTKTWAVLIGVEVYPDPKRRLYGCINDINDVESLLTTCCANIEVIKLTASNLNDTFTTIPPENTSSWPTVANVKSALDKVTVSANGGDQVYIHFSGHGTQHDITLDEDYYNLSEKDAALVLYRAGTEDCYLKGREIAEIMDKMVKKQLVVTAVLDCCNSGSITRKGDQESIRVRGVEWDPTISRPQTRSTQSDGGARDGNPDRHWLLDPKGYTLLAACGPHEKSSEHRFSDGKIHGVLTYWMMSVLAIPTNRGLTFRSLYHILRAKLHVNWPNQNPMLFGGGETAFLGLESSTQMEFAHIIETLDGGDIRLDIGRAHGVCEDDEYAVYPQHPMLAAGHKVVAEPPVYKVTDVKAITSTAKALSTTVGPKCDTGWYAKPITHFSIKSTTVRISDGLGPEKSWQKAVEDRKSLRLAFGGEETASFIVRANELDQYQILNADNTLIKNIPTFPTHADQSIEKTLATAEHLARFRFIEGLENEHPDPEFQRSFSIEVDDGRHNSLELGMKQVKDQEAITVVFKNLGKKRLYLAIYDLKPLWAIKGLFSDAGQYRVVDTKNSSRIRIKMLMPANLKAKRQTFIEDVLKVFVTTSPTSFAVLEMTEVPSSNETLSGAVRGSSGKLSSLLASLQRPRRNEDAFGDVEWAAQNFIVRTTLE